MKDPQNTQVQTVIMKDPVTGERISVPVGEAPPVGVSKPAVPASAPRSHGGQGKAALAGPVYGPDGDEIVMTYSTYRGKSGVNTYSNVVRFDGDLFYIEELSPAAYARYRADIRALKHDTQTMQNQQQALIQEATELQAQIKLLSTAEAPEWASEEDVAAFRAEIATQIEHCQNRLKAISETELEDVAFELRDRNVSIHRALIEECVRGCSNPDLATRDGRDNLYSTAIQKLAMLVIRASIVDSGEANFLAA